MDDDELEKFCRKWADKKAGYVETKRYAGSSDMGRDVVGFLTDDRLEGPWDNYQCKQYRRRLGKSEGLLAIGKVLYWASQGNFKPPLHFFFVAPKELSRSLELLVDKPSELKKALIADWDSVCATNITNKAAIPLDAQIMSVIDAFDFKKVRGIGVDEIIEDSAAIQLLFEKFGKDPGAYPPGVVPIDVQNVEMRYVDELVFAYGERANLPFADHNAVLANDEHGPDLRRHRHRFFEADAFQKFYRDNTSAKVISAFRDDVRFGVVDRWEAAAVDTLARVKSVMDGAGVVNPAGPLAKYGNVPVKQGLCHHFVNDGEMSWKKTS